MSLSNEIREQILRSFRAELAEHAQTMTDGLLALEQAALGQAMLEAGQRKEVLETIFRAAHSLKGAARAVGATAIEQLAHAMESALDGLRNGSMAPGPALFTACYHTIDAIRETMAVYEQGEMTPPLAALQALAELAGVQPAAAEDGPAGTNPTENVSVPADAPDAVVDAAVVETAEPATPAASLGRATERDRLNLSSRLAGLEDVPPDPVLPVEVVVEDKGRAEEGRKDAGRQDGGHPENEKPASERPTSAQTGETIRVSVNKLDALMAQLSELMVTRMRAEQRLQQVRQFQEFIALWQKEWLNTRSAHGRLARREVTREVKGADKDLSKLIDFTEVTQDHLRQMGTWFNELSREYTNDTTQMSLVIDKLEEEIKRVRMLPLSTITGSFPRMVRDLAQELNKEAVLEIVGGDTELDKRVLEQIKDPLVHLLRNAIDHGIEPKKKRLSAGKPRTGKIVLMAEQSGKDVVISVSDDGAGVDLDSLRRSAMRKRGAEAQALTDTDLVDSMFQTGVSTATMVTDISGRGVGLDVVRRNVDALNGRIDVTWEPGQSTTFKLSLPLRLTGTRGLLVRVSGQTFVLPIAAIERILLISPSDVVPLEGRDTILFNDRPITLVSLEGLLDLPRLVDSRKQAKLPVVILAAAERRMAFVVDELLGEQEVVIKDMGWQLVRIGGIAGASVMGSGEVVLILNPNDLIKLAMRGSLRPIFVTPEGASDVAQPGSETAGQERKRILVVDDSLTTRTLEKNILEAAGYNVQAATDGEEVFSIIAENGMPDLIITDVTMPRMNGFELTRRVKNDPQLSRMPVILVTSLESPEDKARGIEVGADAYIVKGRFDQNHLLDTVEQLI